MDEVFGFDDFEGLSQSSIHETFAQGNAQVSVDPATLIPWHAMDFGQFHTDWLHFTDSRQRLLAVATRP